mgnify:CR=1 FL=1
MTEMQNKIDFAVVFTVENANPNGDPLNGNRPRLDYSGRGEISDVCLKRKIRNRMMDDGQKVFVQSDDRVDDDCKSLRDRAEKFTKEHGKLTPEAACAEWLDVRTFGQLLAFKSSGDKGVSIGIRGPVTIQSAFSVDPVSVTALQITKSVSSETSKTGVRASDTMGMKFRVDRGTYVTYGSINANLAKKVGFSSEDAEHLKNYLCTMFENDSSSARPDGTMAVQRVYWWVHDCANGQYSSARVHGSVKLVAKAGVADPGLFEDYEIKETPLEGLKPEILGPF